MADLSSIGVYFNRTLRVFGGPSHIDFEFMLDEDGGPSVEVITVFNGNGNEVSYSDFISLNESSEFRIKFYGENAK